MENSEIQSPSVNDAESSNSISSRRAQPGNAGIRGPFFWWRQPGLVYLPRPFVLS